MNVAQNPISIPVLGLFFLCGTIRAAQAQSHAVDAEISSQVVGNGTFNYTLTLNNETASTLPITLFWLAWMPDEHEHGDLPAATPTVTTLPAGWSNSVLTDSSRHHRTDDDFIQFYTSGTPLMPGHSLVFEFNSTDSPADIIGPAAYLNIPAATSYVYRDYEEIDDSHDGTRYRVQAVPEPSSRGLFLAGLLGLLAMQHWKAWISSRRRQMPGSRPGRAGGKES